MLKISLYLIGIILLCWFTYWTIKSGVEKHEKMECERWIEYSKEYKNWYWTDWQKQQCQYYHYEIQEN